MNRVFLAGPVVAKGEPRKTSDGTDSMAITVMARSVGSARPQPIGVYGFGAIARIMALLEMGTGVIIEGKLMVEMPKTKKGPWKLRVHASDIIVTGPFRRWADLTKEGLDDVSDLDELLEAERSKR